MRAPPLLGPIFLLLALLPTFSAPALARPPAPPPTGKEGDVPEPLRPWKAWVVHGKEEKLCPFLHGVQADKDDEETTRCLWPAALSLSLDDRGGRFTQVWRIYKRDWAPLPGDDKVWPQEVKVDGKAAVVADPATEEDKSGPAVLLLPGDHTVTGSFLWDEMPESLAVPPETGLLSLTVRGTHLTLPSRDESGKLWLHKSENQVEADVLEMTVHRQITDDIPLLLTTRIELRVSGKSREAVLGHALPAGFTPLSLAGKLPVRLEPDSRLRVQVRPGTWQLTLVARHDGPVTALSRPVPEGPWAQSEVWVFDARPDLRQVTVEGIAAIDPQQTTLPDEWKRLPAYPVKVGDTLKLTEQRRGDSDPAPDQLKLVRQLWLDFDGGGYTVSDTISGTVRRAWRLDVNPPTELGRVAVSGKDQFITRSAEARAGVEIRQGTVDLSADSRIPGGHGEIPAVSWNYDFHQVEGVLHLPPGWRLFHVSGADEVPETWLRHFTLLDLFLVLITAMAVARLFGVAWGVLSLLLLCLIFPESEAPRWVWLLVLLVEALLRVLPEGRLRLLLGFVRLGCRVALVLFAVTFAVQQVRHGLYPALQHPERDQADSWAAPALTPNEVSGGRGGAPAAPPAPPARPAPKSGSLMMNKMQAATDEAPSQLAQQVQQQQQYRQYAEQYDPNAAVQTGPGVPRWDWETATLRFSGPVQSGQELRLWLLPPWANLLLALLRVLLLALLVVRLLGLQARLPPMLRRPVLSLLPFLLLLSAHSARAELPPQALLDELSTRLLEPPACRPSCAASPRLQLEVLPRVLRARMEVGAAAATAVPLPGGASQWLPERVLLDGKPAPALLRTDDGRLWLQVPEGSHQVLLEGPLPSRETVQIALPLKSHRVEARVQGWRLEGLHEDGLADDNLQLTRVSDNRDDAEAPFQQGALPPFVRIEREVQIGLKWQVDTRVVRESPTGAAVVLEVPLLPGESVTSADVRVHNGKALLNMGPGATEVAWHSLLQERSPLHLTAPRTMQWTEVFRLDVSPIWHVELSGIPVVHQQDETGVRRPEWRPWPGEEVRITITRPEGLPGRTLTIDHSDLLLRPGLRATDATLDLNLRSSRGGQHVLSIPEGALLQSVTIDGKTQPVQKEKNHVTLPLLPGSQHVRLEWRQGDGVGFHYQTPRVDLHDPSVNAGIQIKLGGDRWPLLCGGPRLGPAVLFWSFLLVLLLVAAGLGQVRLTPLRTHHWVLLGLGLSQVPTVAAAAFVAWLLLLGWRRENLLEERRFLFNLRQLLLVAWTCAALGILVLAIQEGLLGEPDMQISGNGSAGLHFAWFADRVPGPLPHAFVISVPLSFYRVAMLLWALWIAASLLRWLRWGWAAFNQGGLWRKRPPKDLELAKG